jgi:hypothetical protein
MHGRQLGPGDWAARIPNSPLPDKWYHIARRDGDYREAFAEREALTVV